MASSKDLSKEEKIKKEISRLKRIYKNLDSNMLQAVDTLIHRAAFMTVSLAELEHTINTEGYTDTYQNGEHQTGTKQSEAVKSHISMTRNLSTVMKHLTELTPAAPPKAKSKLQAFKDG